MYIYAISRDIFAAALYQNEEAVGEAVRDSGIPRSTCQQSIRGVRSFSVLTASLTLFTAREEIFITTKLWSLSLKIDMPIVNAYEFVMAEARKSLRRLGTYADLYLIHSPHNPEVCPIHSLHNSEAHPFHVN